MNVLHGKIASLTKSILQIEGIKKTKFKERAGMLHAEGKFVYCGCKLSLNHSFNAYSYMVV